MTISIRWLGHASFQINVDEKVIYVDLYRSKELRKRVPDKLPSAFLILCSHSHDDHCFPEAIGEVRTPDTTIVAPADCGKKLGGSIVSLEPGEETEVQGVGIKAVHAYNVKRFRSPGTPYHPKGFGVGYLVKAKGKTIYFAGDTDIIPEMSDLGPVDVALLPCGDTYTMDNADAVEATKIIEPKVVIPMHMWDKSIDEFRNGVEAEGGIEFHFLKEGETFNLQ